MDSQDLNALVNSLLSTKVTTGVLKKVPFSIKRGVSFSYNEHVIVFSPLYANTSSNCYFLDMRWGSGDTEMIYGIPIKSGVNIMKQFQISPIKELYAFDSRNIGGEITNYKNTILYMIDKEVL